MCAAAENRKGYKKCYEVYMINWVSILSYRRDKLKPEEKKEKEEEEK